MKCLISYVLSGTCNRGVGGFSHEYDSISLTFNFPINPEGGLTLVISNPSLQGFDGKHEYTDADSVTDLLDNFVSLDSSMSVVYDPTPLETNPRLSISLKGAPEKVIIF